MAIESLAVSVSPSYLVAETPQCLFLLPDYFVSQVFPEVVIALKSHVVDRHWQEALLALLWDLNHLSIRLVEIVRFLPKSVRQMRIFPKFLFEKLYVLRKQGV